MTSAAAEKRFAAITEIFAPSNEMAKRGENTDDLDWFAVVDACAALAPLGRTERWQSACTWAKRELESMNVANLGSSHTVGNSTARWAAFQGSVWMVHAAE